MDNLYNNMCRTCLTEKGTMSPIFRDNTSDKNQLLNTILITCPWIKVQEGDGLPDQICVQCLQEINRIQSFKQQCEKSECYLRRFNVLLPDSKINESVVVHEATDAKVRNNLLNLSEEHYYNQEDYFDSTCEDNGLLHMNQTKTETNYLQNANTQKPDTFSCGICKKLFKTKIILERHKSKHKKPETTQPSATCNICNKTFRFQSNLERHKVTHTGERRYLCNICGKGFTQLSYLKIHSYIHTGHKPYKCQTCERSFSAPGTLVTHIRTHTGERPHVCKFCGKDFPQLGYLKTHIRIHTGERPIQCKVCHKTFNQSGRLSVHMRIHSGERPYPCNQCGKSFAVKGTLKKHLRTHSGERPYICSICGQAFAQSGTLAKHTKVHNK